MRRFAWISRRLRHIFGRPSRPATCPRSLARAAAPGNDVELDYLKARYRGDVSEALSRALERS